MSKSKTTTKPWVQALGKAVSNGLSAKYGRTFVFRQKGPYTQGGAESKDNTGIVFNEEVLQSIKSPVKTDKTDFRFGFSVWRYYRPHRHPDYAPWFIDAGFEMWNKALARDRFMQNVRNQAEQIEKDLLIWKSRHDKLVSIGFDQIENGSFGLSKLKSGFRLRDELRRYGDLDRRSTGKNQDRPGSHVGSRFSVKHTIPDLCGLTEDELEEDAESLSEVLLTTFEELNFLYELLWPEAPSVEINKSNLVMKFDPAALEQDRTRIEAQVASRLGQTEFRIALLHAYQGRCAVSGCDVEAALQAAHLIPHTGPKSNHVSNGLLLRADIHNLFDRHLIGIEPYTRQVLIAPELRSTQYGKYEGCVVASPRKSTEAPHPDALRNRFELFQQTSAPGIELRP